jgi:ribosomal protein S18 acetylase RimI-like enzyme
MADPSIEFRDAVEDDCSSFAILSDAATRRLNSYIWSKTAQVGQSWHEIGREFIRMQSEHFIYYKNWQAVLFGGRFAGGLNCYLLPKKSQNNRVADGPDVTLHLNELKTIAAGTWYIATASVFPEFRNRGVGDAMLKKATELARIQGVQDLTLLVGSFNEGAKRLYCRFGFTEWERRPFTPFPGSDPEGQWILMRYRLS